MGETKTLAYYMGMSDPRFIHTTMHENIKDYSSFVDSLYYAIENIILVNLESKRNSIVADENQISEFIVLSLYCLKYDATRETSNNGNVDITVKLGEYTWLGEAKIFHDNSRLMDGFRQLTTRYSTASNLNANQGGYLIYNFRAGTKRLIDSYKAVSKIQFEIEFDDFKITDCKAHPLRHYTSHNETSSGLKYTVKHIPFSFHFDPQDKSGKTSKDSRDEKNAQKNWSSFFHNANLYM